MNTNVYVDGFNLYYGAVKGTPYKWLDIYKLCALMFPKHSLNRIRYFTALINPTARDTGKRDRQLTYIRALKTTPNLTVTKGSFMTNKRRMPLVSPLPDGTDSVMVLYTEEKGSDVNLAAYLIYDACNHDYKQAIIISNDTDLVEAIGIVRYSFGLHVVVVNPRRRTAWPLRDVATSYRYIRKGVLSASQFLPVLHDAYGTIKKPLSW